MIAIGPEGVEAGAAVASLFLGGAALLQGYLNESRRSKREEEETAHKARGVAVAVYPDILKTEVVLISIRDELQPRIRALMSDPQRNYANIIFQMTNLKLNVPFMMGLHIKRLHWLPGDAGPTVLQLISVMMQYNSLVDELIERMKLGVVHNADFLPQLDGHLRLIHQIIENTVPSIRPLHDDPPPKVRSLLELLSS